MEAQATIRNDEGSAARLQGSVRKLKSGYGFIAGDDGHDYFFHWSGMRKDSRDFRELEVRDRVDFSWKCSPDKGDDKRRAFNITT